MLGLHIRHYGATHDYLVSILSPIQSCGLDTGITTLSDVVYQGHLNTYDNLRSRRDLPNHFFFLKASSTTPHLPGSILTPYMFGDVCYGKYA